MIVTEQQHGQWTIKIGWLAGVERYYWEVFLDGDKQADSSHSEGSESEAEAIRDAQTQINFIEQSGWLE